MFENPEPPGRSKRLQVLAIDDDPEVRDLIATALQLAGRYDVRTANGFDSALHEIDALPGIFDGIFLDIQMPEVDGIEACSLIRILPDYEHVPIIMLTAMTGRRYLDRAFRAGASDYIRKPFRIDQLQIQFARERRKLARTHHAILDVLDQSTPGDFPDILSDSAFQSYILRVTESSHAPTLIRAINVFDIPLLAKFRPEERYHDLVESAAAVIRRMTIQSEPVICHRGLGSFLVAADRITPMDPHVIGVALKKELHERDLGRLTDVVDVFVGQPVSVPPGSRAITLDLIAEAVESVERLNHLHSVVPTYSEWRSERDQKQPPSDSLKHAAYIETLDQIFDEGAAPPWPPKA